MPEYAISSTSDIKRIDFFIETSVSMKGYVNANEVGNYNLKDVVPLTITELNRAYNDSVQIYTVDDRPRKYPKGDDEFSRDLRSGNILGGKSSQLQNIFSAIIDSIQPNSVSFLVTDCIVDLGKDLDIYTESSTVTNKIYKHLTRKDNISAAVFQYESDFNGDHYYDMKNTGGQNVKKHPYYQQVLRKRPFYVWVFGTKQNLREILSKNVIEAYKNAYFFNISMHDIGFKLLKNPKKGKVAVNQDRNSIMIKEATQKRPAVFILGFNLNNVPKYFHKQFMEMSNYQLSPKHSNDISEIKVLTDFSEEKKVDNNTISANQLTHFIQVKFNHIDPEMNQINIRLFQESSDWFDTVHIDSDFEMEAEALEGKTFAFKCITDAFVRYSKDKKELLNVQITKTEK
ncbi:MAG: hypothetical protein AAF611_00285 [Bacteroidota bacterium]